MKMILEDIEKMFGVQSTFTPVDELTKVFNFKKEIENKTNIGIMFNVEFLEYFLRDFNYINNKQFTFFYDSKTDFFAALNVKTQYKYNNVELISIENINLEEQIMPKHFDVVFTNPPYETLDLKLIKTLIDNNISDEIICVHPGSFLFNHNKNNLNETLKNTKALKDITFFWGNDMFETLLKNAHCITVWNKNHNSTDVTVHDHAFTENEKIYNNNVFTYTINVNDITVHSKVASEAAKFLHKFENCDSILNHITNIDDNEKRTDFGFKCPTMMNGFGLIKRDYGIQYAFFSNGETAFDNATKKENLKLTNFMMTHEGYKKYYPIWFFNTKEERDNFINYLKLKCTRFLLSLIKHNPELNTTKPCRIIPWMDFTKHYSEEDLKKAWGIDEELWDYIDKFIPDYYEDYKEISK